MQDAVQENRADDVKLIRGYNLSLFKKIANDSGSPTLAKETGYLDRARFYAKDKFWSEILGDIGFFAGTIGKNHFRLIKIAVRKGFHGKGYGRRMMRKIIVICRRRNLQKITLRTNKGEGAVNFDKKFGGIIVGTNGADYEMEIPICSI